MKVLFLLPAPYAIKFIHASVKQLQARDVHVRVMCASSAPAGDPPKTSFEVWNWCEFYHDPIHEWGPDRIVVWNAESTDTLPAAAALSSTYQMRVVECGWLPQKGTAYCLDRFAPGSRLASSYEYGNRPLSKDDQALVDSAVAQFAGPAERPVWLPSKYVFCPMQLEHDTTITNYSPMFKKMHIFLAFMLNNCHLPIVVKNHPKDPRVIRPQGCIMADPSIPAHHLTQHAEFVVGINSTVLIEALTQYKKVVNFGRNVAEDVMIPGYRCIEKGSFKYVESGMRPKSKQEIDYRLALLLKNQYDYESPPSWHVDSILAERYEVRLPDPDT